MGKLKLHVEVGQYQFVETEVDSPEEAKETHDEIKRAFRLGSNADDFNNKLVKIIDSGLEGFWGSPDEYEGSSKPQKDVLQALKRFKKRK